jgi:RHS repeat-associated protein
MAIDLATGNVHLEYEIAPIPGKLDLVWERLYSGTLFSRQPGLLGAGWTCRYESRLTRQADGFEFVTPAGASEWLRARDGVVERGETIRHYGACLEIFFQAGRYIVQSWDLESELILRYCFRPGLPGQSMPLSSIEDLTGQGLDLERDKNGRLSTIRQRLEKRFFRLDYYPSGLLQSVTLHAPNGQNQPLARYEYDVRGCLSAAFDALDYADRYEYGTQGRLTREITKHGGVFTYRYDDNGRCIRYSGLDRYEEKRLRFLDAARITEVADSYGATSRYQYLPSGQIVSEWNPLEAETRTEYDEHGRIIAKTSSNGATTRYSYDERGNRCQTVDALGQVYQLSFNDQHQAISLNDPADQTWRRRYDTKHRLIGTTDPTGGGWTIDYDADGNFVAVTNPKGHTRHFRYEGGVLAESSDWLGNVTRAKYDILGRLTTEIDPLGHTFGWRYDAVGNLIQIVRADGSQMNAAYDAGGNLVRLADPEGRASTYRYGPCHRLLGTTDGNGHQVKFVWGTEAGRLDQVINERGEVYRFVYNAAGHCTEEIGFDGRHLQRAYDAAGAVIRTTNGNGETIDIERDALGRIVGQQLPDGKTVSFSYDPLGNVIEAVNSDCTVVLERDTSGRLMREIQRTEQGEHWVRYTLDAFGETTHLETDLGLQVDYELDANGRWSTLRTGDGHTLRFHYDAGGKEVERHLPGGFVFQQRHNPAGYLTEQCFGRRSSNRWPDLDPVGWVSLADDAAIRRVYTRDSSGLVTGINDRLSGGTSYSFDPGERLLQVMRERGLAERFEYDVTGNLTRNGTEGNNGVVTYDPGNRLVGKGHTRYEHDAHGRLVRKIEQADSATPGIWIYQWDALDQLRAVTRPNGQTWEYAYDAFSRRVLKRGPKEEVRFVWSAHVPVQEKSSKHDHWRAHLFSQNSFVPLAQVQDRKFYPILTDHIGTPQEMANQAGEVVWKFRGKTFGEPAPDSDQAFQCLFRFQGQYYDSESGLHYNRFRYYDCSLGRYISADPIGIEAGQNLYVYGPNPVAWVDPLGLAKECGKLSDPNPIPAQIRKEYEEIKLGRGTPRISAGGQTIFQAWEMAGRRDVDQWRYSREWDVPGTSHRILQRPDGKLGYVLNHDYSSPFLFPAPWYPEGGTVPKKLGGR